MRIDYKGIKINYDEDKNLWSFEDISGDNEFASLKAAKNGYNKSLKVKYKEVAVFQLDTRYSHNKKSGELIATRPHVKSWNDQAEFWVKDKYGNIKTTHDLQLDTPENRAKETEIHRLEREYSNLREQIDGLIKSMAYLEELERVDE